MNDLFFELIQVSLGTRICLSHTPSADEWGELYAMAKKQSLVGICFAAVQKLTKNQEPKTKNLDEVQYLTWMGLAAKIQQRNEVVNRQCVELQERLARDGFRSCIMKGQGIATLYGEQLAGLRQSGDIDVWVLPNDKESENEHIARVVKYAKGFNPKSHFSGKHIDLSVFSDTKVELHVTPAKMNYPWHNWMLQNWFHEVSNGFMSVAEPNEENEVNGFKVLPTEFNLIYLLLHCYDHLLFEGVGLRQIMDYYCVLLDYYKTKTIKTPEGSASACASENLSKLNSSATQTSADSNAVELHPSGKKQEKQPTPVDIIEDLGLTRFASALMWVLGHVFAMEHEYMFCEPNEKEGRFLLKEIMTGGNFGKYGKDVVMEGHEKGKVAFALASMKHKMRFLTHYPSEIIWSPYAMLCHWMWKRNVKI